MEGDIGFVELGPDEQAYVDATARGRLQPLYVLFSLSIACYVPELFPTEVRLRGSGIANAAGRAVNIVVPYVVVASLTASASTGCWG
jgi:putative MFS transporter